MTHFEVVLDESGGVTVLTPWVSNLSFRLIDPGGYGLVTFDLSRQIDARNFEEQADLLIYNGETGEQVCGGRLVNPGRAVSRSGDVWNMSALGEGPAHMNERKEPYILDDRRLDVWYQTVADEDDIGWSQGGPPDPNSPAGVFGSQGWVFKAEEGATMVTGDGANITYSEFEQFPDARIGGYYYEPSGGATSSNHVVKVSTDGWATTDESDTFAAGGTIVNEDVASVASPRTEIQIRYQYVGGGSTADTKLWAFLHLFRVFAMRRDRNRDWIDGGSDYLMPAGVPTTSEVITDCWARFCPRFDLASARIDDVTTVPGDKIHTDLVWPDGVTPAEVFNLMMTKDPGYTWSVWERQGNGLFRAEWRAYDLDPRYEMTAQDGFSETSTQTKYTTMFGATDDLNGHYTVTTAENPDLLLAARGITPSTTVTDVRLSGFTASELGARLAQSELEAGTAQVTVARKVYDHYTGRWVEPFQILPGYMCRVAGAPRRDDYLNEDQPDGACIFQIVSNDYSATSGSSRLELNSFTVDERRALADFLASGR